MVPKKWQHSSNFIDYGRRPDLQNQWLFGKKKVQKCDIDSYGRGSKQAGLSCVLKRNKEVKPSNNS